MRKVFQLLLVLVSLPTWAAVGTQTTTRTITLYRSGTSLGTHATPAACETAKQAAVTADSGRVSGSLTYECRDSSRTVATFVAASSSSSSSSTSFASSSSSSSATSSSSTPAATWTHCANEGDLCDFTGTRTVRFGIDTRWTTVTMAAVSGGVRCNTSWFADPASGATKTCQLQSAGGSSSSSTSSASSSSSSVASSSSSSSAPSTVSVSLGWTAPTQNTDGSAIGTITGYRLYYGESPSLPMTPITLGNVLSHSLTLNTGRIWYFRVSTITADGEGPQSNAANRTL